MKKSMPPEMKKGPKDGKKMPSMSKRDEAEAMPEGDAAAKRADRPARKSGGSVKKGC